MFKLHTALFALACAIASAAGAADYGSAVPNAGTERVISITPATRYVHVDNGESVTFVVDGKRFSWHVSTYPNVNEFALESIAPPGLAVPAVRVMVAPAPGYLGA
jgi:hypothetical protein